MIVSKLARFFTWLYGEGKKAAISKSTYIWTPSSRSYIVFDLKRDLTTFKRLGTLFLKLTKVSDSECLL